MTVRRSTLAASLAASLAFTANAMAASAPAPTESTRLANQYSEWAGGHSNAESLVAGLRNGAAVTIVTNSPDRSVSIAGFTPASAMSYGSVASALAGAQHSLQRLGIRKPNAEQIQAALIGGEISTANGGMTVMKGSVVARGPAPGKVASSR
ncbi:MAG TPA: hypothetical protein VH040_05730 [Usitatibacter sp.]|jgi:hypothetical protein|nr:hypothetical protein [Usitatibacter sp.]